MAIVVVKASPGGSLSVRKTAQSQTIFQVIDDIHHFVLSVNAGVLLAEGILRFA
jgi:hypothetical protein